MNDFTISEAAVKYCYDLLKTHKSYCNRTVCLSEQELKRQEAYFRGMRLMFELLLSNDYQNTIPDEFDPYKIT